MGANSLFCASFLQALAKVRISLSPFKKNESCARIWDLIFKNDEWIRQVLQIQSPYVGLPIPCLVGCDLKRLSHGKTNSAHLTLLVNDWTGDVQYRKQLFFKSLQDHEYDKEKYEIRLKGSDITVHIRDAITSEEIVTITDPTKVFHKKKVSTYAMYYTEDILYNVSPDLIGGIEGVTTIKLKFRDGSPVCRDFSSTKSKVVGIRT